MAVITITKENFEAEVLKSAQPVLLDFWAAWCGPCRMLSPIVDEVAEERTDVKVGKVNVDEQPDLAAEFGVMSIPTLLLFENEQQRSSRWQPVPRHLPAAARSGLRRAERYRREQSRCPCCPQRT